jgi:hypothetical protein
MGDMLARGQAWLAAQQKVHASRSVVYRRGGASVILDATVGKTIREYTDGYGATIVDEARDYLVHAAELVLGGERTLPLAGDTIEETDEGQVFTYEVTAMGPEPCFRYSDTARVRLRIHTKLSAMVDV